jgi:hypothetical protein
MERGETDVGHLLVRNEVVLGPVVVRFRNISAGHRRCGCVPHQRKPQSSGTQRGDGSGFGRAVLSLLRPGHGCFLRYVVWVRLANRHVLTVYECETAQGGSNARGFFQHRLMPSTVDAPQTSDLLPKVQTRKFKPRASTHRSERANGRDPGRRRGRPGHRCRKRLQPDDDRDPNRSLGRVYARSGFSRGTTTTRYSTHYSSPSQGLGPIPC